MKPKTLLTLNIVASSCFALVAVLNIIDKKYSFVAIYFALSAAFLCIGLSYFKKSKK